MIVIEQLAVSNSTILNQELNWENTDWNKEADLIKYLLSQPIKCNDWIKEQTFTPASTSVPKEIAQNWVGRSDKVKIRNMSPRTTTSSA